VRLPDTPTAACAARRTCPGRLAGTRRADVTAGVDVPGELIGIAPSLVSGRIIGRSAELGVVRGAVEAAARGGYCVMVVAGEAGIGKSALRRVAVRRACELGMTVLAGRAVERDPRGPYAAIAEAVGRGLAGAPWLNDRSLVPLRSTLAQIVPEFSADARGRPPVAAVAEALLRLLKLTAQQQASILVVEDLHWADPESLATLAHLVDNIAAHHVSCLLTCRSYPVGDALRLVRRLADDRAASVLDLRPLAPDDVDRLTLACLEQDAAPGELMAFIRQRADGLPFLVEELLAGLVRSGALVYDDAGWRVTASRLAATVPVTLAESLAGRLRSLHPRSREVVCAAALLGRRVDLPLLTAVAGVSQDVVLASLREATYAQLLVAEAEEIRFRHALTQEHVRDLMLAPERVRLACRALRTVEEQHPGLPGGWCDLAAELCELTDDRAGAVRHLITMADRARAGGAVASAVRHLRRAALLVDADTQMLAVQERLAEVQALTGDVDAALHSARAAYGLRRRVGVPDRGVELELSLGRALVAAGRIADAAVTADRARRRAGRLGDAAQVVGATVLAAQVAVSRADLPQARALAEEVLRLAGKAHAEAQCEALEVLGRCLRVRDVGAAEQAFAAALGIAHEHKLLVWEARALHELGTIDLFDTLRTDRLAAARRAAVAVGAPAIVAVVDFHLASLLVSRGEVAPARATAERAVGLSRRLGLSLLPSALTILARCHAQEARIPEMEATIAEVWTAAPNDPVVEAGVWSHVRAMAALHRADRDATRVALDRAAELLRHHPGHHDPHRGMWALLHTLHGDPETSRREAAGAAGSDTRMNKALLLAADAVAQGRRDRPAAAERYFGLALDALQGYERAELLVHLAVWLVAPAALADHWDDPVTRLQSALRWFAAHGHARLAADCRVLLRSAGAPAPRRGRGLSAVPDRLRGAGVTSREVDVLRLVGQRLTNREIAARLVLSPKTVEKHVGNLLAKLGATDRGVLAEIASEL